MKRNNLFKKLLLVFTSLFLITSCEPNKTTDVVEEPHMCEKPRLDLYILSGQSNMVGYSPISDLTTEEKNHVYNQGWYYAKGEGSHSGNRYESWQDELKASYYGCSDILFGPEVGFSKFMEDKYEEDETGNRHMAMLKYSQGGSAMYNRWFSNTIYEKSNAYQLHVDAAGNSCPDRTLDGKVVGDLYYNLVTTVREQIEFLSQNYCVHVIGLIWNQGCHDSIDAHAYKYEENLTDFISDFRKDINQPNLPVIVMQIFDSIAGTAYPGVVAEAQKSVADKDPNVVCIETGQGNGYSSCNPTARDPHHSGTSMLKLGYEEAKACYEFKENR